MEAFPAITELSFPLCCRKENFYFPKDSSFFVRAERICLNVAFALEHFILLYITKIPSVLRRI